MPNTKSMAKVGPFDKTASYWSFEQADWNHRKCLWIWVSGPIPDSLELEELPIINQSADGWRMMVGYGIRGGQTGGVTIAPKLTRTTSFEYSARSFMRM